jgi:hypothetical protein
VPINHPKALGRKELFLLLSGIPNHELERGREGWIVQVGVPCSRKEKMCAIFEVALYCTKKNC